MDSCESARVQWYSFRMLQNYLRKLVMRFSGGALDSPEKADAVILVLLFLIIALTIYLKFFFTCTLCLPPQERGAQSHMHPELYVKNIKNP